MKRPLGGVVTVVLALAVPAPSARPADWYVTPQGRVDRAGTAEAPWDIASTLGGGHREIQPGDTVWIGPGTYHAAPKVGGNGYEVRLVGSCQIPGGRLQRLDLRRRTNRVKVTENRGWLGELSAVAFEDRPDLVGGGQEHELAVVARRLQA